ncbi:MAG TPA: formate--tetrahydrofolate ligase [Actinomycetes bacterium]|nr:formate--tetrahydrofolate ligase [Actinomycetes bacterium]
MSIPSDLDIARASTVRPIGQIAETMGLPEHLWEPYGRDIGKISLDAIEELADRPPAKYILVTAITPTPLGEGKTTTSIGLAQGFGHIGKRATLALRQPSLGPTFGIKGGAAGGGYSQVIPMEKLNLHLTGDFHAITAAHNLLAAMLDNHLYQGNELGIDLHNIEWRRVMDMNDRALRNIVIGLGARLDGVPRQTGFDITAASELMVLLALATSEKDLRDRVGKIVVGYTKSGDPITAEDLNAGGSMAVILRDALRPNVLQTIEGQPALIHTGPFGNIATGQSSIVADLIGIRTGDYLITEAGFGADIGAEKFFDMKCRMSGLQPSAAVVVATVRALKAHSGRHTIKPGKPLPPELLAENPDEVAIGGANLRKHLDNLKKFGITPVVAINAFPTDHDSEHDVIRKIADEAGARSAVATHVAEGGAGAVDLARVVEEVANEPNDFRYLYPLEETIEKKIETIATSLYGATGVAYTAAAAAQAKRYQELGYGHLPIVIAKTHLSITSDASLLGAPENWGPLQVRELRLAAGAGYIYAVCGEIRTMPGLSKHPAAERIDIDAEGNIVGLS